MVVRESVEHTALSGSQFFKPPALPVVTDLWPQTSCENGGPLPRRRLKLIKNSKLRVRQKLAKNISKRKSMLDGKDA
jgi:hypothetical protein